MIQRVLRILMVMFAVCAMCVGCRLNRSDGGREATPLPDLNKATRNVGPGDTLTYKGGLIRVLDIEGEDAARVVRWSYEKGQTRLTQETPLNGFVRQGDFLFQFQPTSTDNGTRPIVRLNAYNLPELLARASGGDGFFRLSEGEIEFFQGGFVSLESVWENSYTRTDDDTAVLTLVIDDEWVESKEFDEFRGYSAGGKAIRIWNIYPGDGPGDGQIEIEIQPTEDQRKGGTELAEVLIPSSAQVEIEGITISAEPITDAEGDTIYLRLGDSAMRERSYVVEPGGSIRVGRTELVVNGSGAEGVSVTPFRFREERRPYAGRRRGVPSRPEEPKPERGKEPTTVTRKLAVGQEMEFHGARFLLTRVLDMDPTSLSDDRAEFTVTHDGGTESLVVKEGSNYTIHTGRRWFVLEAQNIEAQSRWSSSASIRLKTGTFLVAPETGPVSP